MVKHKRVFVNGIRKKTTQKEWTNFRVLDNNNKQLEITRLKSSSWIRTIEVRIRIPTHFKDHRSSHGKNFVGHSTETGHTRRGTSSRDDR